MQITKLVDGEVLPTLNMKKFTDEELQNEFDFYLTEKIVKTMYEKCLVSNEEFYKISEKNRLIFSPYLSKIML